LRWHFGNWQYEGQQRGAILDYAPDADVIIAVDSDEIYSEKLIENIINYGTSNDMKLKYLRVPFIHYWRSFSRCVLHDPAFPVRVTIPNGLTFTDGTISEGAWTPEWGVVNHMGYATTPAIMAYKWQIHGHKDELRHDVDWYKDVFMANRQYDCHPVGSEFWQPEDVNPLNYMPSWMQEHPFYGMKVIE